MLNSTKIKFTSILFLLVSTISAQSTERIESLSGKMEKDILKNSELIMRSLDLTDEQSVNFLKLYNGMKREEILTINKSLSFLSEIKQEPGNSDLTNIILGNERELLEIKAQYYIKMEELLGKVNFIEFYLFETLGSAE